MTAYRMKFRPVGFATVPRNVKITFVRKPKGRGYEGLLDMPVSKHNFGVFETDRDLTDDELRDFQIIKSEID